MVYRREYPKKRTPKNPNEGLGGRSPKSDLPAGRSPKSDLPAGRSPKTSLPKKNLDNVTISRNAYDAYKAPAAEKATPVAKPKAKPAREAPKAPAKAFKKGPASGTMAYEAPKSNFKGNWTGAAATDMQKRGGAKISRNGGLLGKLRGK